MTALPCLRRLPAASVMLLSALLSGACSRHEPEAEPVRPVRIAILGQGALEAGAEFPGEVRPRYESRLGFRVAGKITAREVEVGSAVHRGQVLTRLGPQDLRLAASLVSNVDGVVTGIDAEAGQVVTAGTPVVRVARLDALDVVIGIPEERVGGLRMDSQVAVRL